MRCCIYRCNSYTDRQNNLKVTFHLLPNDKHLFKIWMEKINRPKWKPTKNAKICSLHFKPDDYYCTENGRRKLKYGVVPSLNLDETVRVSSPEPIELTIVTPPEHSKQIQRPHRDNTEPSIRLVERSKNEVREYLILCDTFDTNIVEEKLRLKLEEYRLRVKIDNQKIRTLQKQKMHLEKKVKKLRKLNKELKEQGAQHVTRHEKENCSS